MKSITKIADVDQKQTLYWKSSTATWPEDYVHGVSASQDQGWNSGGPLGALSGRGGYIAVYYNEYYGELWYNVWFPTPIKPNRWIFETVRLGSSSNGHPAKYPSLWYWDGSNWIQFFWNEGWDYGDYWRNYEVNCPAYSYGFRMRWGNGGRSYSDEICIRNIRLVSSVSSVVPGTPQDHTSSEIVPAYKLGYRNGIYYGLGQ